LFKLSKICDSSSISSTLFETYLKVVLLPA
jgi:hypothetical protein